MEISVGAPVSETWQEDCRHYHPIEGTVGPGYTYGIMASSESSEGGGDVTDPSWGWGTNSDEEATTRRAAADESNQHYDVQGEDDPLVPQHQVAGGGSRMGSEGRGSQDLLEGARPSHINQYLTAVAATLGAFSMGCVLGYSSPAGPQLGGSNETNHTCPLINDEALSDSDLGWFSSTVNIGALVGAPCGGYLINTFGRRTTMLLSIVTFLLGWGLIGGAQNFAMLVVGRIFCGFCCGLVSLSVPTYLGEIASADIRGLLGTGFQLMVVIGILYTYAVGAGLCWQWLALACLVPAVGFVLAMFFSKESPDFLLAKGRQQDARDSLQFFRGKDYNIEPELSLLQCRIEEAQRNKASFSDLKAPHVLRPLLISLALMFFQQFSGINAILFNLTAIFDEANVDMSSNVSSITIAAVQVVATCVGAALMDRAGRKLLLLISSAAMGLSLVAMGVYFYLAEQTDQDTSALGWLPLASLIVFISVFSIGYGPIPWLMMGELFSPDVRDLASSLATLTNWSFSFIVTIIFQPLREAINNSGVYWMFAAFCILNFVFCFVFVKETKGLTGEEISAMFGGPPPCRRISQSSRL